MASPPRRRAAECGNRARKPKSGYSGPALSRGVVDPDPLFGRRRHGALGCIGGEPARHALQNSLVDETDNHVRDAIHAALNGSSTGNVP